MKYIALLILMSGLASSHARTDTPAVVTDGLATYQKSGGKEALAAWLKDSPLEKETAVRINMEGVLAQIEVKYGKMIGFEHIRSVSVAPSLHRIHIPVKFERGPAYAVFDCYKTDRGRMIPALDLNANLTAILPPNILGGLP